MTTFCTDVDLLNWEPDLLRDAAFASQTLLSGSGELSGTSFSIASGSFADAGVQPHQVVVLGEPINGCFPIMSIDSSQSLTLSVMQSGIEDAEDPDAKGPPGGGTVSFVVRTFWPQRAIVSELLSNAAGAGPSRPGEIEATIVNPQALRRACTLGTIQMIYSALAAASPDQAHLAVRAELYERLYRRALRNAAVDVDLDGDGQPDAHRMLSVVKFHRA